MKCEVKCDVKYTETEMYLCHFCLVMKSVKNLKRRCQKRETPKDLTIDIYFGLIETETKFYWSHILKWVCFQDSTVQIMCNISKSCWEKAIFISGNIKKVENFF